MYCKELKPMMDSYISDELLVETNHEVLQHLENCRDCLTELAERRSLQLRIRHTVKSSDETRIDPVFMSRITAGLRETALRPGILDFLNMRIAAVGFAALLLLAIGSFIWISRPVINDNAGNLTPDKGNDNSNIATAVRASWQEITSQAVGDHKNCAVEFHLTDKPISLDASAASYGSFNKDLDKTVNEALQAVFNGATPKGITFLEAHSCIFEGRRFAHIVMRHKGRIVSVLVTDTDLPAASDDIQTAHFDGALNAAGFHIGHHAVFVVSELPDTENTTIARSLAPAMRLHAEKVGA